MTLAPECTFALDGAAASILVFAIPLAILATALTIFDCVAIFSDTFWDIRVPKRS